jgi:hypothetical protein
MYKGVKTIIYEEIDVLTLKMLAEPRSLICNYRDSVNQFIRKFIPIEKIMDFHILNLLYHILENVHDHGSNNCEIIIGKCMNSTIIEIYEKDGGFELEKIKFGTGGVGYREICRNVCSVFHSKNGNRTYVLLPN